MSTLRDFQSMFCKAMLGPESSQLEAVIVGNGLSPASLLQMYRRHVLVSLTEALQSTFPVVCRLVDQRFFAYAADAYIRQHPPESPCLFEYGASFPGFLEVFPACRELVYIADVARLEWGLNVAYHAVECVPMAVDELRGIPGEQVGELRLRLDAARTLLRSAWPVDAIWRANQGGDEVVMPTIDLASGGVCLEILRWEEAVGLRQLETSVYVFRAALAREQTLATATEEALAMDEDFDCATALGDLFRDGAVVGWRL